MRGGSGKKERKEKKKDKKKKGQRKEGKERKWGEGGILKRKRAENGFRGLEEREY